MEQRKNLKENNNILKNKAFTLIELLAVIVILAIIALIAVPIILDIIDNTKKSSIDRSKEVYLGAVEQAIARKNLTISFNPSTCTVKKDGNLNCDAGELVIEFKGLKPNEGGTLEILNGKIISNTLKFDNKKEEPIIQAVTETNKTLAGKIPQGNFELGDEYIINVDGTNKYHFYVLSVEEDKVSLIMSNNICDDGTLATESNTCKVLWYTSRTNLNGPITAMNYLYEATKNWNNIDNIQINYTDEGNAGSFGYEGIKTIENETSIISKTGAVRATYENLKARLPRQGEVLNTGCTSNDRSCPAWVVNGLEYTDSYDGMKEDIKGITTYWCLSSSLPDKDQAWRVEFVGKSNAGIYVVNPNVGVRPVIEVSKSNLFQ